MRKNSKTYKLILSAMMTAVICICSIISIPTPIGIPVTLQTFGIIFAGVLLGPIYGLFSVIAYILLGIIGVPIFSGFGCGVGVILGPTGGFIFGFIPLVILSGIKVEKLIYKLILVFVGICLCHIGGVIQYSIVMNSEFFQSALVVSLPFILKDLLSGILAIVIQKRIKKLLKS